MAKTPKKTPGRPKVPNPLESQIAVRVSASVRDRLDAKGQQMDRSVGWILRKALEEWLERNP